MQGVRAGKGGALGIEAEMELGQLFYCCPFYKDSGSVKIKFYLFLLDPKLVLAIFIARWNQMSFLEVGE